MKSIKWLEYGIKDKAARDQLEDKLYKNNSVHIPEHPESDGVFVVQIMADKWKANKFGKAYGSFLKSDKPRKTIKENIEKKIIAKQFLTEERKRMIEMAGMVKELSKLNESNEIDVLYDALLKVPLFNKLSMDRQGELSMKIMKMIKKG